MKIELGISIFQLENSEKKPWNRLNQVEDRILGLEDKAEGKQMILIVTGKEHAENMGHYQKTNSSNYSQNWGRKIPSQR